MSTRPRLTNDANWLPGIAALGLFVVLTVVFLRAGFPEPAGFPDASITAGIGYAMFDLLDQTVHASEEFLVAFVLIAVALDAALDAAVMLAKREDAEAGALADGGHRQGGED